MRDLSLDELVEELHHQIWNTSINWQTAESPLKWRFDLAYRIR